MNETVHIVVAVNPTKGDVPLDRGLDVPMKFADENGILLLNISNGTTRDGVFFHEESNTLFMNMRFQGKPFDLAIPARSIVAVLASEERIPVTSNLEVWVEQKDGLPQTKTTPVQELPEGLPSNVVRGNFSKKH